MVENIKLDLGDQLPDFKVTSADGEDSTLQSEMGTNGLLIYVLRGTWCPFCIHQIVAARARYPNLQKHGVNAVFVIPEEVFKIDGFRLTVSRPLPFGLHADEEATIANTLAGEPLPGTSRKVAIYLLNREREVKWRFVGWDDDYPAHHVVLDAIKEHLAPSLNQTA
jgi:peroxiredoxin